MTQGVDTDVDIRAAYAADASGLVHVPDGVARPESVEEVAELLRQASTDRFCVTPAGSQTSTTGASVAASGVLLSLQRMNLILDVDPIASTMRVQAGALVGDVKRVADAEGLLFAPDPTSENECTIGGAIACNASGARTLKYGATRQHVRSIKVVLASGDEITLRRNGLEKNTAGYSLAHDPVDWFVGSEGTLGVVVEAELALLRRPDLVIGTAVPFRSERDALAFVAAARRARDARFLDARSSQALDPRCLEYFDEPALTIARSADDQPGWAEGAAAMVYLEQEATSDTADAALHGWLALADQHHAYDDIRAFTSEGELRHARAMRHAVPVTMNERGARYTAVGGRKVSTDWAVAYELLHNAIEESRKLARDAGVEQAVTYGHAGNGHPHQNYLAFDAAHLARIEHVVEETLKMVVRMGGTVSAEHGIGKLKRRWLSLQISPLAIGVMRAVKRELDPHGLLAPGNIF